MFKCNSNKHFSSDQLIIYHLYYDCRFIKLSTLLYSLFFFLIYEIKFGINDNIIRGTSCLTLSNI